MAVEDTLIQRLINRRSLAGNDPHGDAANLIWLQGGALPIEVTRKQWFQTFATNPEAKLKNDIPDDSQNANSPTKKHIRAPDDTSGIYARINKACSDFGLIELLYDEMRDFIETFETHVKKECRAKAVTAVDLAFKAGYDSGHQDGKTGKANTGSTQAAQYVAENPPLGGGSQHNSY